MAVSWNDIATVLLGSPLTSAQDRVRTDKANRDDFFPYVVGHRVTREPHYGLDNTLHYIRFVFHIECWGETREEAAALEDEVTDLLEAAGYPLDANGPDGLDPNEDVRCVDLYLTVIETPEFPAS
jgi:hypothetical protein